MTVKIFFCYAREDEALRQSLGKQLKGLKRQGFISMWHDREIIAGTGWESEIDKHLKTADIVLLLVSPDFMDSDYCYGIEMQRAMERHQRGEARVVPVIVRPVYWQGAPFGNLHALPKDAKPITTWTNQDEAFYDAAEGIRKVATEIIANDKTLVEPTHHYPTLDKQITLWLENNASKSKMTWRAYEKSMEKFRNVLHQHDLDLDSEDILTISSIFHNWAWQGTRRSSISNSTFNQRLSIIRSFYLFARKQHWIKYNPLEEVERLDEHNPNAAKPLSSEVVKNALDAIDRSQLVGKRDYALLLLLLTTGRWLSEVAALRCGDITIMENEMTITFKQNRGGKIISHPLQKATAQAIQDYLTAVYGNEWTTEAPIWINVAWNQFKGQPLGTSGISDVCKRRLGTSKVMVTNHTFVMMKNEAAAKEIENLLNRDSLIQTQQPQLFN